MAAFPDLTSIPYTAPVKLEHQWQTLVQSYEGGIEVRKQKNLFPRRNFTLNYSNISVEDAQVLWNFYNARKGRFEAFNFFMHYRNDRPVSYLREYVGVGDGVSIEFNLPSIEATDYTLYLNNVELSEGSSLDWLFGEGDGDDGADLATFAVAPTLGYYITYDFTGRLKVHGRFADDITSFDIFFAVLASGNLKIQGLLNE